MASGRGGRVLLAAVIAGLACADGARGQAVVLRGGVRVPVVEAKPAEPPSTRPMPLVNADDEMASFVSQAREAIAKKAYGEAVEILQALLNRREQCFVPLADGRQFVSLGVKAAEVIGELPPAGLKLYRGLYDGRAERLYETAARQLNPSALRQVVRRFGHSGFGDDALNLLGGIHFDRGEFSQAARCWRGVIDGYKGTDLDVPTLLAKAAVAHHFAGEGRRAAEALKRLEEGFAVAEATLGGRKTNVAAYVRAILAAPAPPIARRSARVEGWPSLAGAPDSVATMDPCRPVMSPRWTVPPGPLGGNPNIAALIAPLTATRGYVYGSYGRTRVQPSSPKLKEGHVVLEGKSGSRTLEVVMPALIHPVVADGLVLYRGAEGVIAHDVLTGQKLWQTNGFPLYRRPRLQTGGRVYYGGYNIQTAGDRGQCTLTIGGGKVFAVGNFPPAALRRYSRFRRGRQPAEGSTLAAFSLSAQGYWLWRKGDGIGESDITRAGKFLTAPTYRGGRLFVVVEYLQAYHLLCLDAETGELAWSQMISQQPVISPRMGYNMRYWQATGSAPAVSDGRVFAATNAGVVGAFEADTGTPLWAYQYDSSVNRPAEMRRGLRRPSVTVRVDHPGNPIVVAGGLAICLPADAGKVLALRVDTGEPIWRADRQNQHHLSAAPDGRVVLASPSVVVLDAATGQEEWSGRKHVDNVLGRPAVTRDAILASGKGSLIRVSLPDFAVTRPPLVEPRSAVLGNLVSVAGKLVAGNAAGLSMYSTYEEARDELTARLRRSEDPAALLYHRGMNAFYSRRPAEALPDLQGSLEAARRKNYATVTAWAEQGLYRAYVALGNRSSPAGRARMFKLAEGLAFSDRTRGEMLLRWARHFAEIGDHARAAEYAQRITAEYVDQELVDVKIGPKADPYVRDYADTPRFKGSVVGDRLLKELIDAHGQQCYAAFDLRAKVLLDSAVGDDDPDAMVAVVGTYRRSVWAPVALLGAAETHYRRALAGRDDRRRDSLLLAGTYLSRLAREYPASGLGPTARVALVMVYQKLNPSIVWMALRGIEDIPPDTRVSFAGVSGRFGDVIGRLTPSGPRPGDAVAPPQRLDTPLARLYADTGFALVVRTPAGGALRVDGCILLFRRGRLCLFDPSAASMIEGIRWEAPVTTDSNWAARYGQIGMGVSCMGGLSRDGRAVAIATRTQLAGVDVKTGKILWKRGLGNREYLQGATFAGGRCVIQDNNRKVQVLDIRTGRTLWSHQLNVRQGTFRYPPQVVGDLLLTVHRRQEFGITLFDMVTGKALGSMTLGRSVGQAFLTPDGLLVVYDGKSIRMMEPLLGIRMKRELWSVPMPWQMRPAILGVTGAYVIVSPNERDGRIELRGLAERGRIVRTFETGRVDGRMLPVPSRARVVGERMYVTAFGNVRGARASRMYGRIGASLEPSMHAYDLKAARRLWSVDLDSGGPRGSKYVMPAQFSRRYVSVLVKSQSYRLASAVFLLELASGRLVGEKLVLPGMKVKAGARRIAYANVPHVMLCGPVMAKRRLVVPTPQGIQVLGRR